MAMNTVRNVCKCLGAAAMVLLVSGVAAMAQDSQEKPTLNKNKQQQQQQQSNATTLSLDNAQAAPANAEEDSAFKAIQAMPEGTTANLQAKLQAGEDFLQKYPQSHYRSMIYSY